MILLPKFDDPLWEPGESENLLVFRVSAYVFLLPSNTFYGSVNAIDMEIMGVQIN